MPEQLVLVVESDPTAAEIFQTVIETRLGVSTILARDGQDALHKLQRLQPSLLIIDAVLPGVGGPALADHIKGIAAARAIPVVLVADSADIHDNIATLGSVDTIRKPLEVNAILRLLRRSLPASDCAEYELA